MALLLVTVGTDGTKDWVKTPDGQKFSLGAISVLSFVSKLAKNSREARRTLDSFLQDGEAMLKVNDDLMWGVLAPRRARWASSDDGSFIAQDQQQAFVPPRTPMTTLSDILDRTEKVVAYCNKQAAAGKAIDPQAVKDLQTSAHKLASQSSNSYFYGLGEPSVDEPEEGFANDESSSAGLVERNKGASDLAFDTYDANMATAEGILVEARATVARINDLADRGKRFNRVAALRDVAGVTNKVATICEKTALTEEWVQDDLQKLASKSRRIFKLFHPKG